MQYSFSWRNNRELLSYRNVHILRQHHVAWRRALFAAFNISAYLSRTLAMAEIGSSWRHGGYASSFRYEMASVMSSSSIMAKCAISKRHVLEIIKGACA